MSFLVPLFLLGALAAVGPVVFHLVRRSTRRRVMFSATHFLVQSAPRLNRRSRIQHPWLLLLRCLVVAVLATGFARPFLRDDTILPTQRETRRHVVMVLDESASMQRTALWEAAVDRVLDIAASLNPSDQFALVSAGSTARTIVPAERWAGTPPADRIRILETLLADRNPGWDATHLDSAIDRALKESESMAVDAGPPWETRIHIVSDFAAGTRVSGLAGHLWPDDLAVCLEELGTETLPNASLHWLGWTETGDDSAAARFKVVNHTDSLLPLRLRISKARTGDEVADLRDETLAPRETRLVRIDLPAGVSEPLRADLSGDDEEFDNTIWFIPPEEKRLQVSVIGGGDARNPDTPLYYLERASSGWRDLIVTWAPLAPSEVQAAAASLFTVIASPLSDTATQEAVRRRIEGGTTALLLLPDNGMFATASALVGESISAGTQSPQTDPMLGTIDFQHPLFAAFADPRFSDFTRIRFWQPTGLALPPSSSAAVAARFEDGAPAIVEYTIGAGRVVLWSGNWTPSASQWVLSSKFVPWLQTLVERATGGPPRSNIGTVGESVPGAASVAPAGHPGIHELTDAGDQNAASRIVALNMPEVESDSASLPADIWEQLGVPISATANPRPGSTSSENYARASESIEAEQQLWRWLLLGAIALLAVESIAAWRLGRSVRVSSAAASA